MTISPEKAWFDEDISVRGLFQGEEASKGASASDLFDQTGFIHGRRRL